MADRKKAAPAASSQNLEQLKTDEVKQAVTTEPLTELNAEFLRWCDTMRAEGRFRQGKLNELEIDETNKNSFCCRRASDQRRWLESQLCW